MLDLDYSSYTTKELSFEDKCRALAMPIPSALIKKKADEDYIEWHTANAILNFWFPGSWSSAFVGPVYRDLFEIPLASFKTYGGFGPGSCKEGAVVIQQEISGSTTITVTDPTNPSRFCSHTGVGQDTTFEAYKDGLWSYNVKGVTSVESHSFKRAAVKFGIGINLYSDRSSPMSDWLETNYGMVIAAMTARGMVTQLVALGKLASNGASSTLKFLEGSTDLEEILKIIKGLNTRLNSE